jgi:hypothetical protein
MQFFGKMPRKTTPQLNVRISDEARKMFDEIEAQTGLKDSALAHIFVSALQKHWEKHQSITLPFELAESAERKQGKE